MLPCPRVCALRPRAFALSLFLLLIAPSAGVFAADTADPVALRVRVGLNDKEPTDWSGKVEVSGGAKVESIRGVRWMPGDHADGNAFTVNTRRRQPQGAGERQRAQRGEQLPMTDNGIVVTLSGAEPDAAITIDTKPGKATVKLADLRLGQGVPQLDGRMEIQRVPAATSLAETMADEDYPAAAVGKDGTVYVAYLSFTRGKDFQGPRERPATPESGPNTGPLAVGEVRKIEKPADFDYLAQPAGGEQIFLRTYRNGTWGEPVAVTDGKQELYRPAVAVDAAGKVWVFYSAHVGADANLDHGNWELLARSFDQGGKTGGAVVNVSNAKGGDFMPAACTDSNGSVWVAWVGGRGANFNVFRARQEGDVFGDPTRVSDSKANEWEPAIAASTDGRVAIAWDAYDKGDYDVYVATMQNSKEATPGTTRGGATTGGLSYTWLGKPQLVAGSGAFEVRPSLAYDISGQLWVAYEGSGDGWGKDFGALKKKGQGLYQGRYLGMKVLKPDGSWHAPAADVMTALPAPAGRPNRRALANAGDGPGAQLRMQIAPSFPRLTTDAQGRVWLAFRGKPGGNWRVGVGSVWCEYVTRLDAQGWSPAAWVPRSNNILDNRPALTPAGGDNAVMLVYTGDGRGEMNPPKVGDPHLRGGEDGDDKVEEALATEEAAQLARRIR